ncbi:MAG: hypothetical protein KKE11_00515 [Gammaproteobacteria bacterium]|nr:hypothetical protein [Gammaproteobacteria bacterium]
MLLSNGTIALANLPKNQCSTFDSIALMLSQAPNKTSSPLSLLQIQSSLGPGNQEKPIVIATHSWVYKNRALIVTTFGDNLSNKMLTGDDDGSVTSKKMEQIYAKLKSATSVWFIKEIQNQLGAGYVTIKKLSQYSWNCNGGTLAITTDQNNNIIAATISYTAPKNLIETRLGKNHSPWDIKTDSLGQSYRAREKSFEKPNN